MYDMYMYVFTTHLSHLSIHMYYTCFAYVIDMQSFTCTGLTVCCSSPSEVSYTCIKSVLHEQWLPAERQRSAAGRQARKLFEGAEREVRQLRLACIHPQMTAYWRNLSAEMQLDSVSAPHTALHIFPYLLRVLYAPSWWLGGVWGGWHLGTTWQ